MNIDLTNPFETVHPEHGPQDNPGRGHGHGREPTEPSWGDVIGGIWHRLTHPLPR